MMRSLSLAEVSEVCAASWHGHDSFSAHAETPIKRVSTNSKAILPGDLFVALVGERFDGHAFLAEVEKNHAVAAIVSTIDTAITLPQLKVENTEVALGNIGAFNRSLFNGKVFGITGSNGKTTVKNMLAAILVEQGAVLATAGNLNNFIGVPLTLLELSDEHQFAVVEMGANAAGEIAYLADRVKPDIALVTNVSTAHIGGFGTIETTAATKFAIYQSLGGDGIAVLNRDEVYFEEWQERLTGLSHFTFSLSDQNADVFATAITINDKGCCGFTLSLRGIAMDIQLNLLGLHNVANALAAAAMASAAGVDAEKIRAGLEKVRPAKGRMQPVDAIFSGVLIDDSYNASPASVLKAIDVLSELSGNRYMVLGDMAELGDDSVLLHEQVGHYCREKGIEKLFACGTMTENSVRVFGEGAQHFSDKKTLCQALLSEVDAASVLLVKGSRSSAMDEVVASLQKRKGGR
ncbi:MAG: UDP-N-acetylmuramoyl-tripeptide--D-alanyl-D-alanine ligase [Pseudomonadales bacterium]|nr:UDP-N-acetylmuramoyl-tripeptide--D-alanyl-D-alanine ligase [Pseudomonadales bacterium]